MICYELHIYIPYIYIKRLYLQYQAYTVMKKVLFIIGLCMLTMLQSACTKEDESEDYFLTFHNGETINVNVPPALDGLSDIDSVEFYWDKNYIATEYCMPFTHKIQLKQVSKGSHRCDIVVFYKENGSRYRHNWYYQYEIK